MSSGESPPGDASAEPASANRPNPRKIILRSLLSLGDIVCFTAVVRELHIQHPGQFVTDVRTPFPELWQNNPFIRPLDESDPAVELIDCHYDRDSWFSVHRSNEHPVHLLHSYCHDVAKSLGLPHLHPRMLKGDIPLHPQELQFMSIPHQRFNSQRYWVLCLGGGKKDATTKWYVPEYVQQIVDYFRGRIQFVQVGAANGPWDNEHWHPDLKGVIDLRGRTSVRDLVRLIHSASGVLCGVTSVMHLAAAIEVPAWQPRPRPCVVVAGGREPRTWYGYPGHRILERVGALSCCAAGGCWHGRTLPLHDGLDDRLCERVVNGHPRCMWMIRPGEVCAAIEGYLDGLEV